MEIPFSSTTHKKLIHLHLSLGDVFHHLPQCDVSPKAKHGSQHIRIRIDNAVDHHYKPPNKAAAIFDTNDVEQLDIFLFENNVLARLLLLYDL